MDVRWIGNLYCISLSRGLAGSGDCYLLVLLLPTRHTWCSGLVVIIICNKYNLQLIFNNTRNNV